MELSRAKTFQQPAVAAASLFEWRNFEKNSNLGETTINCIDIERRTKSQLPLEICHKVIFLQFVDMIELFLVSLTYVQLIDNVKTNV